MGDEGVCLMSGYDGTRESAWILLSRAFRSVFCRIAYKPQQSPSQQHHLKLTRSQGLKSEEPYLVQVLLQDDYSTGGQGKVAVHLKRRLQSLPLCGDDV